MNNVVIKPEILLPKNVDWEKWAVIACDQFTSQPDYWEKLALFVGDSPSTLKIIFPEVYLEKGMAERVQNINETMKSYLSDGLFEKVNGFVLTERTVANGAKRKGLIVAVDLEQYDYHRVRAGIRATEDTIESRLPVRMEIRKDAPLELPHIILLIDDVEKTVIEPLYEKREKMRKLYDFDLNMNGGHIVGYEVKDAENVIEKINALGDKDLQVKKYGTDAGIILAVGDGNHSMATAKKHWDNLKITLSEAERENHPARYALAEILNIYDEGLIFEPIHRVILNGGKEVADILKKELKGDGVLTLLTEEGEISLPCPAKSSETITAVQGVIEKYSSVYGWEVDYVHGKEHLASVTAEKGVGILMPCFAKSELINYVVNCGNLPKKAFSIGTAENKKYYIEAKRIVK